MGQIGAEQLELWLAGEGMSAVATGVPVVTRGQTDRTTVVVGPQVGDTRVPEPRARRIVNTHRITSFLDRVAATIYWLNPIDVPRPCQVNKAPLNSQFETYSVVRVTQVYTLWCDLHWVIRNTTG